jgi:16S rRNA (uracil1498-N3)-methyltransferase
MSAAKPKIRLFVDDMLAVGAKLILRDAQTHYLAHVMRLPPGQTVAAFNGRDGEWQVRIDAYVRGETIVVVEAQTRTPRAEPGPWLLFAPVKKNAVDFVAGKATELGVSRLWPVFTSRTQSQRISLDRLRAHVVEAAEQCRRLTVPEVCAPISLDVLAERWPADRSLVVLDEHGCGRPICEVLPAVALRSGTPPPGFLAGPEGGFAASELDALAALPFVTRASLGPRVLRSETAALAALVCWQALIGDWTEPPAGR